MKPAVNSVVDQMHAQDGLKAQAMILRRRSDLFVNDRLQSIEARATSYLNAGVPVHFRGPAGTGKTTLALQIAASIGAPTILITGDGWLTAGDLIGQEVGKKSKQVVDNFVHNVRKVEMETTGIWADDALTAAIENGYTLIYDEFTRSPPRANTPLLMALEERMVILPTRARKESYIRAHPNFRAIFTSNPDDYVGVSAPQDALLDRMITFELGGYDAETEAGIIAARSGLDLASSEAIVAIIRAMRQDVGAERGASVRAGIMIARVALAEKLSISQREPRFVQLCIDVLDPKAARRPAAEPARPSPAPAIPRASASAA